MPFVIIVILGTLALLFALSYIAYRKLFVRNRKIPENLYKGLDAELSGIKKMRRDLIEESVNIPCESVAISAKDGIILRGSYYNTKSGAPLAILVHGYNSMGLRDFSGVITECIRLGYNLLVVDQRAHGESGGHVTSFGIKERYDVLSWCEYALERFGEKSEILLFGMSMGGASVLMAVELPLPKCVVGIIADSPYSSPRAIIKKVLRDKGINPNIAYPFIKLAALIFGGFNPDSSSAESAASKTDIPILLIHGKEDKLVPFSMSEDIAKSAKDATLVTFNEATHCTAILYDKDLYVNSLEDFLKKKGRH